MGVGLGVLASLAITAYLVHHDCGADATACAGFAIIGVPWVMLWFFLLFPYCLASAALVYTLQTYIRPALICWADNWRRVR
jgi:hypothetical protein